MWLSGANSPGAADAEAIQAVRGKLPPVARVHPHAYSWYSMISKFTQEKLAAMKWVKDYSFLIVKLQEREISHPATFSTNAKRLIPSHRSNKQWNRKEKDYYTTLSNETLSILHFLKIWILFLINRKHGIFNKFLTLLTHNTLKMLILYI